MDTRLRKSKEKTRKGFCLAVGIICCIAAVFALGAAISLMEGYNIAELISVYGEGKKNNSINDCINVIRILWLIEGPALLIMLTTLITSMILVGARNENNQICLNWFDRCFVEIQLAMGFAAGTALFGLAIATVEIVRATEVYREIALDTVEKYDIYLSFSSFDGTYLPFGIIASAIAIGVFLSTGLGLLCLLSIIKKIKARQLWNHTIAGALISAVWRGFKASDDTTVKVLGICILGCLLSASWVGFVPVIVLICIFIPKWIKKYNAVKTGINELKNGNLEYKVPVQDNGELDRLGASVNEISNATRIAFENETKSVRMKTDLISNVSHDLKTPLTAMISYVDLLKLEGLDSPNAPQYLKIVEEKTLRLKKLTEDLFEAAKASSGNIPINMQRLEMVSMVNQALAETEERFSDRNLSVIFTNKADSIHVNADGQLLWRVIENLLVNAGKYALAGSRIYIDIVDHCDCLSLEVKNISEAQLNISAEELMERFKRGDASRNTEGSGLGLAIAKDLTELMNGVFEIHIDGDLFKACVTLEKGAEDTE